MIRPLSRAALCGLVLGPAWPALAASPADPTTLDPAEQAALEAALRADAAATDDAVHPAPVVLAAGSGSSNPDISLVLDTAGAWFSEAPAPVGAHDPARTGFSLQQLELHLASNVDPFFRFEANVVFAEHGVEVEEAYATTLALPGNLQVRAGQFLTRFGRHNPTHPHAWDFLDQPLVVGKMLGGEGDRALGGEVSWLAPLPWYVELAAAVAHGGDHDHAEEEAEEAGGAHDHEAESPDLAATVTLKQFFALARAWGLKAGVSARLEPLDGGEARSDVVGVDLYLRYREPGSRHAVSLQAEGLARRRATHDDRLDDVGGYAQVVWDLDAAWAVGGRYDYVTGVRADPDWTSARQRASAQVTWRPSHFSRLRLQGNHDRLPGHDHAQWGVMLGLQVVVGAHGAHGY